MDDALLSVDGAAAGVDTTGGSDASSALAAWFDGVARAGRRAVLDAGTCRVDRPVALTADGLDLWQPPGSPFVLRATWDRIDVDAPRRYVLGSDRPLREVTIRGLHLVGAWGGGPWGDNRSSGRPVSGLRPLRWTGCTIEGCVIERVAGMGVNHQGTQDFVIAGNVVRDCGRDGITGYNQGQLLARGRITDNVIERCGDDGIALWGTLPANEHAWGRTVRVAGDVGSTTLRGALDGLAVGDLVAVRGRPRPDGVDTWEGRVTAVGAGAVTVTPPVDVALPRDGAVATTGHRRPHDVLIARNRIVGTETFDRRLLGRGIVLAACEGCVVEDNDVSWTYDTGIRVVRGREDPAILSVGCRVSGGGVHAAGVVAGRGRERGIIPSNGYGIELDGTAGCTVRGVPVTGSQGDALRVAASRDVTIA